MNLEQIMALPPNDRIPHIADLVQDLHEINYDEDTSETFLAQHKDLLSAYISPFYKPAQEVQPDDIELARFNWYSLGVMQFITANIAEHKNIAAYFSESAEAIDWLQAVCQELAATIRFFIRLSTPDSNVPGMFTPRAVFHAVYSLLESMLNAADDRYDDMPDSSGLVDDIDQYLHDMQE